MSSNDVKDCVITVPSHWGFAAREALV